MTNSPFTLTLLGTGTSTGVPVIGCNCSVCRSDDPRNRRTRCSALWSWEGHHILVDTATDLRQQALRQGFTRVDAVLITHTHADHIHGIDDLRTFNFTSGAAIPLYGSTSVTTAIRRTFRYIFHDEPESGYRPRLETHSIDTPFSLFGRTVIPVPLQHGGGHCFGYRIGNAAYLTDCNGISDDSFSLLEGLDLVVLDALRFKPHQTHFNIPQAIEVAKKIAAKRTLLTHLSHDVDHAYHGEKLPKGIEFAFDGQTIVLSERDVTS
ncbi:MAG: MBL fold metallo-hydrolase [Desulfuromonas sp.]|nr:MAG: MBL fold metallo-hydrolase [Desulfuromonas sp.]